jgi:hypothetical protein
MPRFRINGFIPPLPYTPIGTHWDFTFFIFPQFIMIIITILIII